MDDDDDTRAVGSTLLTPGFNAHRFPLKPLKHPSYEIRDVPKCERDLKNSKLYELNLRKQFVDSMAELLLVCNEAGRRANLNLRACASKPLSLEYQADRLDIDDPCFGYIVRTDDGRIQGFVSVTTFTNWQSSFRWDSHHTMSFFHSHGQEHIRGVSKVDWDNSLALGLQSTVKRGHPWEEGIVWPRIAELSLLGALGCGRTLVKLIIEDLQHRKATSMANYDYLVLQATDNSIPFYESLGFVRVGAVSSGVRNQRVPEADDSDDAEDDVEGPEQTHEEIDKSKSIISSPYFTFIVKRGGQSLSQVATELKVDVWDIIFLNRPVYGDLVPNSRMRKDSPLHIPKVQEVEERPGFEPARWHKAKDDETPHKIAKQHNICVQKLVRANQCHFEELQPSSRLIKGTQLRISHLDLKPDSLMPYCHWSFPDDDADAAMQGEPSYMMVLKLDRVTKRNSRREFADSLAVKKQPWEPAPLLMDAMPPDYKIKGNPDPPLRPMKSPSGFDVYVQNLPEGAKPAWNKLAKHKKQKYETIAQHLTKNYKQMAEDYEEAYAAWEKQCQKSNVEDGSGKLFSKVVKLLPGEGVPRASEKYKYWFVLTYIPDLQWVRLAPMVPDGIYGPQGNKQKKRSEGRVRWKLAQAEDELDTSSRFCTVVRSYVMKRTDDADKEEWDIWDNKGGKDTGPMSDPETPSKIPIPKRKTRSRRGDGITRSRKSIAGNLSIEEEKTPAIEEETEEPSPRTRRSATKPLGNALVEVRPSRRGRKNKEVSEDEGEEKKEDATPARRTRRRKDVDEDREEEKQEETSPARRTRRSAGKSVNNDSPVASTRPSRRAASTKKVYKDEPELDGLEIEKIPYQPPKFKAGETSKKQQASKRKRSRNSLEIDMVDDPLLKKRKSLDNDDLDSPRGRPRRSLSESPRKPRRVRNAGGLPGVLQT